MLGLNLLVLFLLRNYIHQEAKTFFLVGGHKHRAKCPVSQTNKKHVPLCSSIAKFLVAFGLALMCVGPCARLFAQWPHWAKCRKATAAWHCSWLTTLSNVRPSDFIAAWHAHTCFTRSHQVLSYHSSTTKSTTGSPAAAAWNPFQILTI